MIGAKERVNAWYSFSRGTASRYMKSYFLKFPPLVIAHRATCPVNQREALRSVGQKRKTILRSIVKEDWQFRSELTRPSAGQVLQRL